MELFLETVKENFQQHLDLLLGRIRSNSLKVDSTVRKCLALKSATLCTAINTPYPHNVNKTRLTCKHARTHGHTQKHACTHHTRAHTHMQSHSLSLPRNSYGVGTGKDG